VLASKRQSAERRTALITRRTASTPTTHTLNVLILLQLRLRYPAYARRVEIRLLRLNAAQATQL
jgi:hypothetical protein